MMYIQSFHVQILVVLFGLALVIKALPAHFNSIRDSSDSIAPGADLFSTGFDSALLQSDASDASKSGTNNLFSSEGSAPLVADASTDTDITPPLVSVSGKVGTEIASSGQSNAFGDLGTTSGAGDVSFLDNTVGPSDSTSDQSNQANSLDLFTGDTLDGSSSALAYVPPDNLAPKDNPFLDGSSAPDLLNPVPDISVGDETTSDPVGLAEDLDLPGDKSLFDSVDLAADSSPVADASIPDSTSAHEDASFSGLDGAEGTLLASTKEAGVEGTTTTPTCAGRKTLACCPSKAGSSLAGYREDCISCMYDLLSSIACFFFRFFFRLGDEAKKPRAEQERGPIILHEC